MVVLSAALSDPAEVTWNSQMAVNKKNRNGKTTTKKLPINCKYLKSRKVNDPSRVEIPLCQGFRAA